MQAWISQSLTADGGSSLAVLSLAGDRSALALGPQLAVFAAALGIPAALVVGPQQDANTTAALRAACAAAATRGPGNLRVTVSDHGDASQLLGGVLNVVVAVVDGRAPRVASTMRTTTTVLGVTSGAVTAQQLARVAASAAGDGREIAGNTRGGSRSRPTRRPAFCRNWHEREQHRMPTRITGAVTEIIQ